MCLVASALLLVAGLSWVPAATAFADRCVGPTTVTMAASGDGSPSQDCAALETAVDADDPAAEATRYDPALITLPRRSTAGIRPLAAAARPMQAHSPPDRPPRSA